MATRIVQLSAKGSRIHSTTGATAGNGGSVAAAVGKYGSYEYDAFLKGTISWANIETLVSATLVFYTEDVSTIIPWSASRHPRVAIRLRKSAWTEGSSATFDSGEYTAPNAYSTPVKSASVVTTGLNRIDVTDLVRFIRPTSAGGTLSAATATTRSQWGFELNGFSDPDNAFALWTDDAVEALRPTLELEYTVGATTPTVDDTFAPVGNVDALTSFVCAFVDADATDLLASSQVQVYTADATNTGQTINGGTKLYDATLAAKAAEITNSIVDHIPSTVAWLVANQTYKWRVRVTDNEALTSAWSDLKTFKVTNTPPNAPTIAPADGTHLSDMDTSFATGDFSDADTGDELLAYQFQLSVFPEGDPGWETGSLAWNTGKKYVGAGSTSVLIPYGGDAIDAGTYYVRCRVWDSRNAVSDWTYSSIILDNDFEPVAGEETDTIQLRPRAPWRIRIREMKYNTVGGAVTGVAATNVITTATAHGLVVGQSLRFSSLTGGAGLNAGQTYYALTVPSTTTFTVSATKGGAVVDFTTAITAGALTRVTTRGPGNVVAILEDAKSVGASEMYNSPGEAHWTLPKDHPQISVIEPKLTHYAIDFRQGDGWREVFAGLVWDFDANDRDVVFTALDYLALYDRTLDEKYNIAAPDTEASKLGSKYVEERIDYIIGDPSYGQLIRAKNLPNSPVGFITIGAIASMPQEVTVYSTYQRTLTFIAGLIDSYRAGSNLRTRIKVQPTTSGYEVTVVDNPGVARDNLRLRYGELVQGYRVVPYGQQWATQVVGIGRSRDGIGVMYQRASAFTSDPSYEATYGRFVEPTFIDGVSDENDLARRSRQMAVAAGTLGKQVGIGLRSGILLPKDGWNIMDRFKVDIQDGPVNTLNMGHDGYWNCVGVTWEASDNGSSATVLTLRPVEDGVAPTGDLLVARPISTQREWQVGWDAPDPLAATSRYWLNQSTGVVSERTAGINYPITGTP